MKKYKGTDMNNNHITIINLGKLFGWLFAFVTYNAGQH